MQPTTSIPTTPEPAKPAGNAPDSSHGEKSKESNEGLKSILFTVAVIIAAPVLALLLSMFVFQSYRVDGESMERTLQNNDRLIVWKLDRTWASLTHKTYMPNRGEVIVFTEQKLLDKDGKPKAVIKRVIGLPGERVVIKDNKITVYNQDHPSGFNPDEGQPFSSHIVQPTEGEIDVTVPEGNVFVCGDNRPNSLDSRYFGVVPTSDIRGVASLRIAPVNNMSKL